MPLRFLWVPSVVLLAVAQPAWSQEALVVAQQHYTEGRQAFQEERFEQALAHFQASVDAHDSPNTRLYLARTYRALGRIGEAVSAYDLAERMASDLARSSPRYGAAAQAAQAEREQIESSVARLVIAVEPRGVPTEIVIGQRSFPAAAVDVPLAVDPGVVTVRVAAQEYETYESRVELLAGQRHSLAVQMTPDRGLHHAEPALPPWAFLPPSVSGSARSNALAALGWSALSIGIAGGGLFAGFGTAALLRYRDYEQRCVERCNPFDVPELRQGERYQLAANISLGIGAAFVALGITLLVVDAVKSR